MAQKQKDKAKGKKDKAKDTQHSIPTAGQGKPTQKSNVLARFSKKAKPKTNKVAKKDRPKLPIPESLQDKYRKYAPLKAATDLFVTKNKQAAKELNAEIWEYYLDFLWKKQKAPETPVIEVRGEDGKVDCQGQFMVQQGSKIRIKTPPMDEGDDIADAFVSALTNQGVDEDDARNFVEAELDLTQEWTIPITTLASGDDESAKSAAEKVFLWLQVEDEDGNELDDDASLVLDADEKAALAEYVDENAVSKPKLVDALSFLDRVCNYFSSHDDIIAVLSTMAVPDHFMSRTEFGVNSSEPDKTRRLQEEAVKIIGKE